MTRSRKTPWLSGGPLLGVEGSGEPMRDARKGRAGGEDLGHSHLLQNRYVVVGDDAADYDQDLSEAGGSETLDDLGHECQVRARQK
jgi:hypothetical protein